MEASDRLVIDYLTLFKDIELLDNIQNCVIYLPVSSVLIFNEMVKKLIENENYSERDREMFLESYEKFVAFTTNINEQIESLKSGSIVESNPYIYDSQHGISIVLFKTFKNVKMRLSKEALEGLSIFDYDILNACLFEDATLLTTNDGLVNLIKTESLPIEYSLIKRR